MARGRGRGIAGLSRALDSKLLDASDGRRLAADMLAEAISIGVDELVIEGKYRDFKPQSDVLVRYLRSAQANPAVEAGFLAVLTDVIGMQIDGAGLSDPEGYATEGSHGQKT